MVIPLLANQDLTPMLNVKDEGSIQNVGPPSFVHDQCVCQCTLVSLKAGPLPTYLFQENFPSPSLPINTPFLLNFTNQS